MENKKSTHEFPDWTELKMLFNGKLSFKEEKFIIKRIQLNKPLDAAAEGLKSWLEKHDYNIEAAYKWTQLAKDRAPILKGK
jgi:hypothetical protein